MRQAACRDVIKGCRTYRGTSLIRNRQPVGTLGFGCDECASDHYHPGGEESSECPARSAAPHGSVAITDCVCKVPPHHSSRPPCPSRPKTTKGPMWGYPRLVLGALGSFLEPFCGHVLPRVDRLCSKLTFEIPPRRALHGKTDPPGRVLFDAHRSGARRAHARIQLRLHAAPAREPVLDF